MSLQIVEAARLGRSHPAAQWRQKGTPLLLLLVILCGSIVPKLLGVTTQSLWIDEINVVRDMSYPHLDPNLFSTIKNDAHPPLYPVLMWLYGQLFGTSELSVRLSSAIAAVAGALLCYPLVAGVCGKPVALMTTALFGMSSTALFEAQNVRPYSLVMTMSLVSTTLFMTAVREARSRGKPSTATFLLLCAVNLCLTLTHYACVMLVVGQAGYLGLVLAKKSAFSVLLYPFLLMLTALPSCVWLFWSLNAFFDPGKRSETTNHVKLTDVLSPIRAFFGQPTLAILVIFPPLTLKSGQGLRSGIRLVVDRAVSYLRAGRVPADAVPALAASSENLWSALSLVTVQYSLVLIASAVHPLWMQNKALYPVFPAGYIAFALILSRVRMLRTELGPKFVAVVAAVSLVSYLVTGYPLHDVSFYTPYREQVREAARFIINIARPQDVVVFGAVDLSRDMNTRGVRDLLEPTRVYVGLLADSGLVLHSKQTRTLPPIGNAAARQAVLKDLVARHDGLGSIIIDLPHETRLTPAEQAYLESVSACIQNKQFENQSVVVVSFAGTVCDRSNLGETRTKGTAG